MADIFISYARADRARAERLAHVLGEHGWAVWWDRQIPPGKAFDEVIEEALADAKCVIVLWSHDSVKSEWVKAEASDAARRRILVPILADEARIPLEFRRIQTARLIDWANLTANRDWDQLSQAVAALLGGGVRTVTPGPVARKRVRRWTIFITVAAAIVVSIGVVLAALLNRHRETAPPREKADPPQRVETTHEPAPIEKTAATGRLPDSPREPLASARQVSRPRSAPRRTDAAAAASAAPGTVALAATPTAAPASPLPKDHGRSAITPADPTFDVTYTRGVFRQAPGRLILTAEGLHYEESGGGRIAFDLSCRDIRKVDIPNLIADGQQRMLELRARDQSYRLGTADTATRDDIVAALTRMCGAR